MTAKRRRAAVHPEAVVASDFNGDGIPDLAVADSGDNNIGSSSETTADLGSPQLLRPAEQAPVDRLCQDVTLNSFDHVGARLEGVG